jgi:hypothetical protein
MMYMVPETGPGRRRAEVDATSAAPRQPEQSPAA